MKRIVSALVAVLFAFCMSAPFVYAEPKKYTADNTDFEGIAEYATREQAVARFVRALGIGKLGGDGSVLNKYADRSKISYAYTDEMAAAVYTGLISGYEDDTLRPQSGITRIEALVILGRALSHSEIPSHYTTTFTDTPEWAEKQINRLAAAGIVKGYGDGTLGARDLLTLEQVEVLCDRIERVGGPTGDFYSFVNSEWLAETPLPDGAAVYTDIDRISQTINNDIAEIIFSLYRRHYHNGEEFDQSSNEKKIIDVYAAAADLGHRNRMGIKPILPVLGEISAAKNISELVSVMARLDTLGFGTPLPVGLDTNMYNHAEYLPALSRGYTGLEPSLLKDGGYLKNYRDYIARLFVISGETAENAELYADEATAFCIELAGAISPDETEDVSVAVKICNREKLKSLFKNINIEKYLAERGYKSCENTAVYDIPYAVSTDELFTADNLGRIKAYFKAAVLDGSAPYLTAEMFDAYIGFHNAQSGASAELIPSDLAVSVVQELLGWELGALYIDRYFPENSRLMVEDLTRKIVNEYKKLLHTTPRLTPQTRNAAIKKLQSMRINAAYPQNILTYRDEGFITRPTDEGGNLMEFKMNAAKASNEYAAGLAANKQTAYHNGWLICPQTVNAIYDPISNSITIPAGILQPPFFDPSADFEENLGGIGSVIAHEISHAFDETGAQFDHNGNLFGWWTETDYNAFEQVCEQIESEYGAISTPVGKVDGELTLNENFADIAGMSCILSLAGSDNPKLDKLFRAYARVWRAKSTEGYDRLMLKTDTHSPGKVRVNRVLANFDEFINTYGVIEGDGMYLPADSRIKIWD